MLKTRNLGLVGLALLISSNAWAARIGDDVLTIGKPGAATDKTVKMGAGRLIWSNADSKIKFSNDAGATVKDIGSGGGGSAGITLLGDVDGDFEGASNAAWVASGGSFSKATSGGNLAFGGKSGVFNASSASQTLTNTAVTIPGGFVSGNGSASCWFKTTATDYKLQVVQSSTVLSERVIPALSVFQEIGLSFVFPASGTVSLRVISQSNAADLAIDNCFLGSPKTADVSQAQYLGGITYPRAANCNWTFSATGSYSGFPADSDCTGASVRGQASAPATLIPAVKFASVGKGTLVFKVNGGARLNNGGTGALAWRISDGTNHSTKTTQTQSGAANEGSLQEFTMQLAAPVSNPTFEIQAVGNAELPGINNDSGSYDANYPDFVIDVFYYPSDTKTVQAFESSGESFTAGIYNASWTQTGAQSDFTQSGSPTVTVIENTGSGAVAQDGTNPGFTFSIGSLGKRRVCINSEVGNSAGTSLVFTMMDGVEIGRIAVSTTVASAFSPCYTWVPAAVGAHTIKLQNQNTGGTGSLAAGSLSFVVSVTKESDPMPAPLLVGGVTSSSAGIVRMENATVRGGSFGVECTTDPCVIASQSGGISSVNRLGTGSYAVNFSAGVFSAPPTCVFSGEEWAGSAAFQSDHTAAPTATLVSPQFRDGAGAGVDVAFNMICMGLK